MHFFTPQRLGRFKGFAIQIFRSVCSSDSVLLSTCGFGDWALGLGMHCSLQLWVTVSTWRSPWACFVPAAGFSNAAPRAARQGNQSLVRIAIVEQWVLDEAA